MTDTLSDRAYISIRAMILRCELAPGARVSERQLARRLDLGLNPVHSAMSRLGSDGLMMNKPRSGYVVTGLSSRDAHDIFDAWCVVGSAILRRAALRADDTALASLADAARRLRQSSRADRTPRIIAGAAMASLVWSHYCTMSANVRLTDMYERLAADLQRVFVLGALNDATVAEVLLADLDTDTWLVRLGDPESSVEHFLGFVERVRDRVVTSLQA